MVVVPVIPKERLNERMEKKKRGRGKKHSAPARSPRQSAIASRNAKEYRAFR